MYMPMCPKCNSEMELNFNLYKCYRCEKSNVADESYPAMNHCKNIGDIDFFYMPDDTFTPFQMDALDEVKYCFTKDTISGFVNTIMAEWPLKTKRTYNLNGVPLIYSDEVFSFGPWAFTKHDMKSIISFWRKFLDI